MKYHGSGFFIGPDQGQSSESHSKARTDTSDGFYTPDIAVETHLSCERG